jgi:hypothetical protein
MAVRALQQGLRQTRRRRRVLSTYLDTSRMERFRAVRYRLGSIRAGTVVQHLYRVFKPIAIVRVHRLWTVLLSTATSD